MIDFEKLLLPLLVVGARISGLCSFAPFFSSGSIPAGVKAGLTITLTALLYPVCLPGQAVNVERGAWLVLLGGELLVGFLLGLAVQFIFEAAQFAGQLLGFQFGFSLVNVIDPQTQVDTPVLSIFFQMALMLMFLAMNSHHGLLRGLAASFRYLPPGTAVATVPMARALLHAAGGVWLAGLQIAAPVLAATFMADVALGFVGKASPQLPVLFVGLPFKLMLGLALLGGTLMLWPQMLESEFLEAIQTGEGLLGLAHQVR